MKTNACTISRLKRLEKWLLPPQVSGESFFFWLKEDSSELDPCMDPLALVETEHVRLCGDSVGSFGGGRRRSSIISRPDVT
jgi:hypothetical protein